MARCPECARRAGWRPAFSRAAACEGCGTRLRIRRSWHFGATAAATAFVVAVGGAVVVRGLGWLLVAMAAAMLIFAAGSPLLPLERAPGGRAAGRDAARHAGGG